MNYLIIGNGIAGTEAALDIRKKDPEGSITILTDSAYQGYFRPRLIHYLADEVEFAKMGIKNELLYDQNRILVERKCRIASIDPQHRLVTADDGSTFPYDRLLLAVGARCFVPPVPGRSLKGVFTLRSRTDSDKIRNWTKGRTQAVVIGGGLLGLETAESLRKRGMEVTVVERSNRLLERQLDDEGALLLQETLESRGLNFRVSRTALRIEGAEAAERVILDDESVLTADMVLFAAGVTPRTELAQIAGCAVDRGILVNDRMETSIEGIFAAGDAAQHASGTYGLWLPSMEQGRAAGANMAGFEVAYTGSPLETRLKISGISLFTQGRIQARGDEETLARREGNSYFRIVFQKGKLIGAAALGDPKLIMTLSKIAQGREDLSVFLQERREPVQA